ncbi:MAG TPA: hypothetical protein VKX17_23435 [Planctomycetota bacterium]|nr:hypothetical protein [Planctomycetota bacterium]
METTTAEIYEGTWDEISQVAARFNGHRLRVQVLLGPLNFLPARTPSRYAARMRSEMANAPEPTPADIAEAERETLEFMRNLNENRRRDGAEILHPKVRTC